MKSFSTATAFLLTLLLSSTLSQAEPVAGTGTPAPAAAAPKEYSPEKKAYLANVQNAIAARWQQKAVLQSFRGSLSVTIQYTVHADGTVEAQWLDRGHASSTTPAFTQLGIDSILEAGPFPPFTPGVKKGTGKSFSGNFTFSIGDKA